MITSTLTQPTTHSRALRRIIAGAFVLLAAMTIALVLTLTHRTGAAAGDSRPGGGHGHDNSGCRPTAVTRHYC